MKLFADVVEGYFWILIVQGEFYVFLASQIASGIGRVFAYISFSIRILQVIV